MTKTDAEAFADQARSEIRAGKLTTSGERIDAAGSSSVRTLDDVAADYLRRYARRPGAGRRRSRSSSSTSPD